MGFLQRVSGGSKTKSTPGGGSSEKTQTAKAWHWEFTHGKHSSTTKKVAIGTAVGLLAVALYFKLKGQKVAKPLPPVKIKPPVGNPRRRLPQPPAPRTYSGYAA